MSKIISRIAMLPVVPSMLRDAVSWIAAVEELETAAIYFPKGASDALRIISTIRGNADLETVHGTTRLSRGSIVLLAPDWAYRRRVNSERWHHRTLILRGPWADHLVRYCTNGSLVLTDPLPAWRNWIGEAVELALAQDPGWDAGVAARVALFAEALAAMPSVALVDKLARAVVAEPGRRWRIADLARLCDLGVSGFAHRFRRENGESPARWLLGQRIATARRLLATHPPGDVADLLGFATPFHFSRVFKRVQGKTPTAWRSRFTQERV